MAATNHSTKIMVEVEATFEDIPIKGAYVDGALIGQVDLQGKGKLKDVVPKNIREYVPNIEVEEVLAMVRKDKAFLFKVAFADFGLRDLPLIGDKIPEDLNLGIRDIAVAYASQKMEGTGYSQGLNFDARLELGDLELPLLLAKVEDTQPGDTPPKEKPPTEKGVTWLEIDKKLGPVYFERIGMAFTEGRLQFLISTSFAMGPVALGLEGLSVSSPIDKFKPRFGLRGLSVSFNLEQIAITGTLLREVEAGRESYQGLVKLELGKLTIIAFGAYTTIQNKPSLFIYGVLGYPLGGPPEFFVTGLAAGFGYNRLLKVPQVEDVHEFPLVAVVTGKQQLDKKPFDVLKKIKTHIPPSRGDYFLTLGIKFTSYKLIDSFAMLYIGFGNKLSVGIMGVSKMTLPPPVPGKNVPVLAQIELAFLAQYDFEEKAVKILAALTPNSYVLSPQCRLSGQLAFYCWMGGEHLGDFVLTAGGYHPDFTPPKHYPQVPRISLQWRINRWLSLKGDLYFALTPQAVMAGGSLEAEFKKQDNRVWFKLAFHVIIAWKPYFYEAKLAIAVGLSYKVGKGIFSKIVTAEFKADLKLWGPEFSGIAKIKFGPVSLEVAFGSKKKQLPKLLTFDEFKTSFLPVNALNQVIAFQVTGGLLKSEETQPLHVISPGEFEVELSSPIPVSQFRGVIDEKGSEFGIASMGLKEVTSELKLTVTKDGSEFKGFKFTSTARKISPAIWGKAKNTKEYEAPDLDDKEMLTLLSGMVITAPAPKRGVELKIAQEEFNRMQEQQAESAEWSQASVPTFTADDMQLSIEAVNNQTQVLKSLGLYDPDWLTLQGLRDEQGVETAFLKKPRVMTFQTT